jgi:hypothetical protein
MYCADMVVVVGGVVCDTRGVLLGIAVVGCRETVEKKSIGMCVLSVRSLER